MDITALAALFVASTVNAALPGPCVLMTATRSAGSGWRAGAAVTLGVLTADTAADPGRNRDDGRHADAFGGGARRDEMGGDRRARGAGGAQPQAARQGFPVRELSARDGAAGLAVGLSSPYNLVFYLALLPQSFPAARPDSRRAAMVAALSGERPLRRPARSSSGSAAAALRPSRVRGWTGPAPRVALAIAAVAVTVPSGGAGLAVGPALVSAR